MASVLTDPQPPILRIRGWAGISATVALCAGLALFITTLREGRTTLGTISLPWALHFGTVLASSVAWSIVGSLLIAFIAHRRTDDVLAFQTATHLPLIVPTTLACWAYFSEDLHHRLIHTDDLRWLWASALAIWLITQVIWLPSGMDRISLSFRKTIRNTIDFLVSTSFVRNTFGLVVIQFVIVRLGLALLWRPIGFFERGSDVGAYEQRARLATLGLQPYLDYWVEYPPLFPWTAHGIKLLSLHVGGSEVAFQILFSLLMLGFEAGILGLIHRIAVHVWDRPRGLVAALAYAGLFYPIYISNRHFESIAVFFLLLGITLAIENRRHTAALAIALGMLTKIFPIAGLPALFAGQSWWARTRYLGILAGSLAGVLLPLFISSREFFVASFQNMIMRPGWETIWALADGYFSFGWVHRFRQSPHTALEFNYTPGVPNQVWWATAAIVAALYIYLTLRQQQATPATIVWSTGLALVVFALYLRGWSPQFMVWILPFVLIAFPGGRGFLIATSLSVLALLESPGYFYLWSDQTWVLWILVLARTIALIGLGVIFAYRLWKSGKHSTSAIHSSTGE